MNIHPTTMRLMKLRDHWHSLLEEENKLKIERDKINFRLIELDKNIKERLAEIRKLEGRD